MSKKQNPEQPNNNKPQPNPNGNVVQLPQRCPVCTSKATRAGFCGEHFTWFKAGLISRDGSKPKDFDKKYQAYMRKQAA